MDRGFRDVASPNTLPRAFGSLYDHMILCVVESSKYPFTRYGIHTMVERYVLKAGSHVPSLSKKRVSPHTIRHTSAVHLLRAGVDINTIRAWLGHVSIDTTNVYAEIDLEMKAKALAHCEISDVTKPQRPWCKDPDLMTFLRAL